MSKLSLDIGRINQKLKTRAIILETTKKLINSKKKLSLEEIAIKANISRATIYRYFPNVELLIKEVSLDIHHKSPEELLKQMNSLSLSARILYLQKYYNQLAIEHELAFRRYLSSVLKESISSKNKVRGARRHNSMTMALLPYKKILSNSEFKNLTNISVLLMGIDSLIVAKDVCGLNSEEANKTMKWGLEMILKGINVE